MDVMPVEVEEGSRDRAIEVFQEASALDARERWWEVTKGRGDVLEVEVEEEELRRQNLARHFPAPVSSRSFSDIGSAANATRTRVSLTALLSLEGAAGAAAATVGRGFAGGGGAGRGEALERDLERDEIWERDESRDSALSLTAEYGSFSALDR